MSVDYLLRGKPAIRHILLKFLPTSDKTVYRIKETYLKHGWRVIDLKIGSDGEGCPPGSVVLEKEMFEEYSLLESHPVGWFSTYKVKFSQQT